MAFDREERKQDTSFSAFWKLLAGSVRRIVQWVKASEENAAQNTLRRPALCCPANSRNSSRVSRHAYSYLPPSNQPMVPDTFSSHNVPLSRLLKLTHRAKTHGDDFNVCCRNVWTLSRAGRRNPKATLLALTTTGNKPTGENVYILIRWMGVSRYFCTFFHLEPMNRALGHRLGKNCPAAPRKRREVLKNLFPLIHKFLSHAISPFSSTSAYAAQA
jgi:hypothetical protein